MTEEEKKAIKYLKDYIKSDLNYFTIDFNNNLRISMNLIEKLKKENEELKKPKDNIQVVYGSRNYGKTNSIVKEYISKDKIREIIIEELPDDDICKSCGRYDVNGVVIKQKLIKVLEGE